MTAGAVAALLMTVAASAAPIDDAATLKEQFARPSRDFSTGPLWVWNDWLTEEEIRSTLGDLASQHVQQVWVHPRPGLMTPYLGRDWFRMWKIALDEAKRLDMNVWIYDENSYPSGFAGGLVPEALPQSRGQGVHFREAERPPAIDQSTLAIYRLEGPRYENVLEQVRAGKELPKATYLVAEIRMAPQRGWFGGKFYVDLLRPGVTEKFLEITLGAYQREIGQHFGDRVPGCFTDEPHLAPAGGLHWSERLAARFEQRWGYDLVEHLPSLVRPLGDWKRVTVDEAIATMRQASTEGLSVQRAAGDRGLLFHHRRQLKDGQIVLLVNTSIDASSAGTLNTSARGVEQWDVATGQVVSYPFEPTDAGVRATFHLPPCGSLLLMLTNDPRPAVEEKRTESTTIRPQGPPAIRRLEPNVLLIDYVDVEAGGKRLERAYFYPAQQFLFQQNGMERNPWDSQVQFRDELITKTFPEKSGFEATYRFTIEGDVPQPLEIVIERPDLYTITCNGQPVVAKPGAWWLDKSFGKIDLSRVARTGPNAVTLRAEPFTLYHELEPAYVLGDFRLKATDAGFTIVPPRPLQLGRAANGDDKADSSGTFGWNQQGHPFYGAGVAYEETFEVPDPRGTYHVVLPNWYGCVATVTVNGQRAGTIAYQPWECDVTPAVVVGTNRVEVVLFGTLKNTLGPHHLGHVVGKAWPHGFQVGPKTGPPPGGKYDTIGYGLFQPFYLREDRTP